MFLPVVEDDSGDLTSDAEEVMMHHDGDDGNNEDWLDLDDQDALCIEPYVAYDRDALDQPAFPGGRVNAGTFLVNLLLQRRYGRGTTNDFVDRLLGLFATSLPIDHCLPSGCRQAKKLLGVSKVNSLPCSG